MRKHKPILHFISTLSVYYIRKFKFEQSHLENLTPEESNIQCVLKTKQHGSSIKRQANDKDVPEHPDYSRDFIINSKQNNKHGGAINFPIIVVGNKERVSRCEIHTCLYVYVSKVKGCKIPTKW